jgi:hypothetical protein
MSVAPAAYIPYVPTPTIPGIDSPNPNPPPAPVVPTTSPFAQPTEAGGQASRSFNENFDGDAVPTFYKQNFTTYSNVTSTVITQQITGFTQQVSISPTGARTVTNVPVYSNVPTTVTTQVATQHTISVPLAGRYNGVSVVEWGNPMPRNTAYIGYNYYSNVGGALNPTIGGSDLDRQTAGFEKTIFDNASVGIRLPFVQTYGPAGFGSAQVGDLTAILKYVAYFNPETGNAITGGFAITAPTGGGNAVLSSGATAPHSWLFQPWGGFVTLFSRGYMQGISNIIAPSSSQDVTLWGNSIGLGYWLYRNPTSRFLTAITPVLEVHVNTPLNHRNPNGDIYYMDQVNITTGAHFRFNRAVFSTAIVVPTVGPNPFNVEAIAYMSYWF